MVVVVCLGAAKTGAEWTDAGRQCFNADTHESDHTLLQQSNDVLTKPRTQNPTRHPLPKTNTPRLQPGCTATVTTQHALKHEHDTQQRVWKHLCYLKG